MPIDPRDIEICLSTATDEDGGFPAPMASPIVQTSLFAFDDFQGLIDGLGAENRTRVYTRGRNPTVESVARRIAELERGEACELFASGMAAIHAVFMGLLRAGDHVLFVNQIYGPTRQLARHFRRFGLEHDICRATDLPSIEAGIRPNTRLIWLESPGTMTFRQVDLRAVSDLARERGLLTCVDNSWATPLFQKPLEMGIDLVAHSCTKYLAGHSDVLAGAVVSTRQRMDEIFYGALLLAGGVLAPFDAWLLERGLRTLPTRMRQLEADSLTVARFLQAHPAVRRVFHPGLETDTPGMPAIAGQLRGTSSLFSFELIDGSFEQVRRVIDSLRLAKIGVSWGGTESLVLSPRRADNGKALAAAGIPPGLIRLSVGLEGAEALIADLGNSLAAALEASAEASREPSVGSRA